MRVGSWPFLGQRACGIADGNLDLGRSCGGIAYVGWRNFTGFADAIALAWCLSYFAGDLSQNFVAPCTVGFTELAGANRAGLYVNMVPIFAAFLAMLILSETMYLYHLVALFMVLGGIFLAQRCKIKT